MGVARDELSVKTEDVGQRIQYFSDRHGWCTSMYPPSRWDYVIATEGEHMAYRIIDEKGNVLREWHPIKPLVIP